MRNNYDYSNILKKKLIKLFKKDKQLYFSLIKKIDEVISCENINHYKNLRNPLQDYKRVHVGSFVLIFLIKNNVILFYDFDHHDNIYK
ncbi:addiction module toxin RelE [Candidatus Woesearchaeota archaeon]|nr:addiction module toxin RelE [Candidatus Woesearchaeota archaeon]